MAMTMASVSNSASSSAAAPASSSSSSSSHSISVQPTRVAEPADRARELRQMAIDMIREWYAAFGSVIPQLRVAHTWLMSRLPPSARSRPTRSQQQRQQAEQERMRAVRTQNLLKARYTRLASEFHPASAELRRLLTELSNAVDLLMPPVGSNAWSHYLLTTEHDDEKQLHTTQAAEQEVDININADSTSTDMEPTKKQKTAVVRTENSVAHHVAIGGDDETATHAHEPSVKRVKLESHSAHGISSVTQSSRMSSLTEDEDVEWEEETDAFNQPTVLPDTVSLSSHGTANEPGHDSTFSSLLTLVPSSTQHQPTASASANANASIHPAAAPFLQAVSRLDNWWLNEQPTSSATTDETSSQVPHSRVEHMTATDTDEELLFSRHVDGEMEGDGEAQLGAADRNYKLTIEVDTDFAAQKNEATVALFDTIRDGWSRLHKTFIPVLVEWIDTLSRIATTDTNSSVSAPTPSSSTHVYVAPNVVGDGPAASAASADPSRPSTSASVSSSDSSIPVHASQRDEYLRIAQELYATIHQLVIKCQRLNIPVQEGSLSIDKWKEIRKEVERNILEDENAQEGNGARRRRLTSSSRMTASSSSSSSLSSDTRVPLPTSLPSALAQSRTSNSLTAATTNTATPSTTTAATHASTAVAPYLQRASRHATEARADRRLREMKRKHAERMEEERKRKQAGVQMDTDAEASRALRRPFRNANPAPSQATTVTGVKAEGHDVEVV